MISPTCTALCDFHKSIRPVSIGQDQQNLLHWSVLTAHKISCFWAIFTWTFQKISSELAVGSENSFSNFNCRKWKRERRKLVRELEKEGVTWQAQVERRWLAGLLANEKAVTPLLRFLKATEVGAREGAREREAEWGRINDQADVDLLGWLRRGIPKSRSFKSQAARQIKKGQIRGT